jgi:hypothetical protein
VAHRKLPVVNLPSFSSGCFHCYNTATRCRGFVSKQPKDRTREEQQCLWNNGPVAGSRGSSVSIVSDCGLDDRAIGVRSPAEANDSSSSLCVQTGSGAHTASCTIGTGGPFPGDKAGPGRDADLSPQLVPRSRMSRNYTSSPPKRHHGV